MEQNRTSFPSLLRGDVSGSELPSSGELGGSPSAAAAAAGGREAKKSGREGGLLINKQAFRVPSLLLAPLSHPPLDHQELLGGEVSDLLHQISPLVPYQHQ